MTDHTQLRKLAEAATPGPWIAAGPSFGAPLPVKLNSIVQDTDDDEGLSICDDVTDEADAEFIAAANPQAVLELLDEIERLKKDAERYRWLRGPDFESTRYSRWKIEYWAGQNGWAPMQREQMDVAIDAAMKLNF